MPLSLSTVYVPAGQGKPFLPWVQTRKKSYTFHVKPGHKYRVLRPTSGRGRAQLGGDARESMRTKVKAASKSGGDCRSFRSSSALTPAMDRMLRSVPLGMSRPA